MERGQYRFEINQIIMGGNGEYKVVKREKKKDATNESRQRKWYTLICPNEHEYEIEESHLETRIIRCPSCYHPKIQDVDSDFAAMFVDKEYPSRYTCMSHKKADFYCLSCGNVCKDKEIHTIYQRGYVPCEFCGDGRSYGERLFAAILDDLGLKYTSQKLIVWEKTKFYYDFELNDSNILFEVHGCQHCERGFGHKARRSLEEERLNDLLKKDIAKKNGYRVIEINAKISTVKYIRENIENNKALMEIINIQAINWVKLKRAAMTKRDKQMLEMLKKGVTKQEIAQKFGLSPKSIPGIKRRFIDNGLWDGVSEIDRQRSEEKEQLRIQIIEMQKAGIKSGDICKKLELNPATFKRLMGMDVYPDPKVVVKWSPQEALNVVEKNNLPVELVSGFMDRKTKATWKCKHCGELFEATLIGLESGPKCPQCKGAKKVEEYLSENFPEEYEILSRYIASETKMKFKHLICGKEFYRSPHSIKRSSTPCIECADKNRIIKIHQTKIKNRKLD